MGNSKEQMNEGTNLLSDEMIAAFREALNDEATWMQALNAPVKFLKKRGIKVPKGVQIKLMQSPSAFSHERVNRSHIPQQPAPLHPIAVNSCPRGLVPVFHSGPQTTCKAWVAVFFPRIETEPTTGEPIVVLESRGERCLEWETKIVNEWVCALPIYKVGL